MRQPGSVWRYLLGRVTWAALVVYGALTGIFALLFLTPDRERIALKWAAHRRGEEIELEERSLREEYVDWLGSFLQLDWGASQLATELTQPPAVDAGPTPHTTAILDAVPVTAAYVIPSVLVAFAVSVVLGYDAARRPGSLLSRFSATSFYLVFSVPNFVVAGLFFFTLTDSEISWFPEGYEVGAGFVSANLLWLFLPGVVLTTHLVAGYFRYTQAESRELLRAEFVTLVQSKGAPARRVARHVLRTAAAPMLTLFVTEMLGVLFVTVFVIETVFQIPGVGLLAYEAIMGREIELAMVLTALFSIVAVLSNLVQDVAMYLLDPRVDLH